MSTIVTHGHGDLTVELSAEWTQPDSGGSYGERWGLSDTSLSIGLQGPLWRHTPPIRPSHFHFTRCALPRLVLALLPAIFGDLTRCPAESQWASGAIPPVAHWKVPLLTSPLPPFPGPVCHPPCASIRLQLRDDRQFPKKLTRAHFFPSLFLTTTVEGPPGFEGTCLAVRTTVPRPTHAPRRHTSPTHSH